MLEKYERRGGGWAPAASGRRNEIRRKLAGLHPIVKILFTVPPPPSAPLKGGRERVEIVLQLCHIVIVFSWAALFFVF